VGALVVEELFVTESPTNEFVYVATNSLLKDPVAYRAEDTGQTSLDDTRYPLYNLAVSRNSNIMVHFNSGMYVIDISNGNKTQIGTNEGLFYVPIDNLTITDDGTTVAFILDDDLDPFVDNSGNIYQIFTMSTDGLDTFTQISGFTTDYFSNNSVSTILEIAGDGNTIFFHSEDDVLGDGSNADGSDELFSITMDGTVTQLTDLGLSSRIVGMDTDSTGNHVLFQAGNVLYSVDTTTNPPTVVTIDTLGATIDIILGVSDQQFDISANGNIIYYATREVSADYPDYDEKLIYAVAPDGSNKRQVFTTGPINGGSDIMSPQSSADGSKVSFISSFDFGLTVAGENAAQVYTMTP
jgi:hypothetical protein